MYWSTTGQMRGFSEKILSPPTRRSMSRLRIVVKRRILSLGGGGTIIKLLLSFSSGRNIYNILAFFFYPCRFLFIFGKKNLISSH